MEYINFLWVEEEFHEIGRYKDEGDESIKVAEDFSESKFTTDQIRELFSDLKANYGEVVGNIHQEGDEEKAIGWIFHKTVDNEDAKVPDANDKYIEETRVTVHKQEPKTWVEYFYAETPE